MATISLQDLHLFHAIDRALFSRLVFHLLRDPSQSLLTMSFWLWLEDQRLPNLVTGLLKAPDFVVSKAVDEAAVCLASLAPNQPIPSVLNTTFTTSVLGNTIPLETMHRDKPATINRIRYFMNHVCARVFTDILEQVIFGNVNVTPYYHPLILPGFPHPVFGDVTVRKLPPNEQFPVDCQWGWNA